MSRSIKPPRGSVLRLPKTQLSTLTKFRSELHNEQQSQNTRSGGLSNTSNRSNIPQTTQHRNPSRWHSKTNKNTTSNNKGPLQSLQSNNNNNNNNNRYRNRNIASNPSKYSHHSSETSSVSSFESRDNSRTRRRDRERGRNNNNNNKENMNNNNSRRRRDNTARSKSRTRNNGYKKPMTLNEAKEKVKSLRKQLSEVNESHDRILGEKEDLEDELNTIHERNTFEIEQKDRKINELQRHQNKLEHERNLSQQNIQNLQSQIEFNKSEIQMLQSGKSTMEQQVMTLQQSLKMKDEMNKNNVNQINMMKSEMNMIKQQNQSHLQQIESLNNTINGLQREYNLKEEENKKLGSENITISLKNTCLTNQNDSNMKLIHELKEMNNKQCEEIQFQQQRMQRIQNDFHRINEQKEILENECESQSQRINRQNHEIQELNKKCVWFEEKAHKDEEIRKRLHNTIQELKGNIRVFCRVRPLLDEEKQKENVYQFDNDDIEKQSITLLTPNSISGISGKLNEGKRYNFDFDRVFRPFAKQNIIFHEISQLVQSALDGYKVCIFAYGQTGSGKTFTMEGPSLNKNDLNRGMIPRSVEKIFEHKEKLKEKGWNYQCKATYLEIYNEKIRDLLVGNNNNRNDNNDGNIKYLEIHQKKAYNNKSKTEVYVEGLTEIEVSSSFDVYPLLSLASKNRSVGRTDCNERSSRSHSVFQLFLNGTNSITGQSTFGVLNLIDLAGSERLKKSNATGQQLKETQNINKSLSCLGDVISALSSKKNRSHIPYRNSKLTYLLMNYFGGDAKTLMFVNLCPEKDKIDESLCSLRFAAKVNDCQIGIAKRTVN